MADGNSISAFFNLLAAACIGFYAGYSCAEGTPNTSTTQQEEIVEPVNYGGEKWDFCKFNPQTDKIRRGDIITYTPGGNTKITVFAYGDNKIFLYRRHDDAISGETIGMAHYDGEPYIDNQELRAGEYICTGISNGQYQFKQWRSAR